MSKETIDGFEARVHELTGHWPLFMPHFNGCKEYPEGPIIARHGPTGTLVVITNEAQFHWEQHLSYEREVNVNLPPEEQRLIPFYFRTYDYRVWTPCPAGCKCDEG